MYLFFAVILGIYAVFAGNLLALIFSGLFATIHIACFLVDKATGEAISTLHCPPHTWENINGSLRCKKCYSTPKD